VSNIDEILNPEILGEAKRKLSRHPTQEKQALPTADDIQVEKGDKSCYIAQYTADDVEKLIVKFEKAAAKQIEKAPEDVATAEKDVLPPSFKVAENALMTATEQIRDICAKAVLGSTAADRDQ